MAAKTKSSVTKKPERIAKVLARAGLCSRRDAERWIADGRVTVDGAKIDSPALTVTPETKITVDGQPLPTAEPTRMWRYNKTRGLLTSRSDPQGRATVYSALRIAEGIEASAYRFCIGVQWHPEYLVSAGDAPLFSAFVDAA